MREETLMDAINDLDNIRCMTEDIHEEITNTPDYWTRLEHTYAGMFLQAQISYGEQEGLNTEEMVEDAMIYAHALIQKLKEKEERK